MKQSNLAIAIFEDACDKSVAFMVAYDRWKMNLPNPNNIYLEGSLVASKFLKDLAEALEGENGKT